MKEIKLIVLLVLFWAISQAVFAQNGSKELKIGDQVPEIVFTNILNSNKKEIKLSDLKGKLVILDFWATWCVPCVKGLPHMDSLQKEFKDKIMIIPITYEKREVVEALLFRNRPDLGKLSLSYIYGTNLRVLFPYRGLPHEVWIDSEGKVAAITGSAAVNRVNIQSYLRSENIQLSEKKDVTDYDKSKPFLAGAFGAQKIKPQQVLYSSTIVEGMEGLPGIRQSVPYIIGDLMYLRGFNNLVQHLYKTALVSVELPPSNADTVANESFYKNKGFYLNMGARVRWEATDSSLYAGPATRERNKNRAYKGFVFNYEFILPTKDPNLFRKFMLQDLNRYFGMKYKINGSLEKRKVNCWALTITGPQTLFKSKGGKPDLYLQRFQKGFKATNMRIDDIFFDWLSFHIPTSFPIPIINETNYNETIDFDLGEVDPSDFNEVNKQLKKFGLEFKLVERNLDMIIIKNVEM